MKLRYLAMLMLCPFLSPSILAAPPLGISPSQLSTTESLQATIDRGGPLVYIPKGDYVFDVPLRIRSNSIIEFAAGSSVIAAPGGFKGLYDSLVVFEKSENITFNADGCTFAMQKNDYRDAAKYQQGEWRHVLDLRGSKNITINGGTYSDSGGDGARIGAYIDPMNPSVGYTPCDGITVRRATFRNNNRNGVSLVSGKRVLIEDCIFDSNVGRSPMAGFDAEPNDWGDPIEVVLRRCNAINNRGPAYIVALQKSKATTPLVKIVFDNCIFSGVPIDQTSVYMTIFSLPEQISTAGYLAANLPTGTSIRWNDLEWRK